MGQIRGAKANISACNIRSLSSFGTPYAGMHILVSTDNSAMADGNGNFDAYVVGDGVTAATALELHKFKGEELEERLYGGPIEVVDITDEYDNSGSTIMRIISISSLSTSVTYGIRVTILKAASRVRIYARTSSANSRTLYDVSKTYNIGDEILISDFQRAETEVNLGVAGGSYGIFAKVEIYHISTTLGDIGELNEFKDNFHIVNNLTDGGVSSALSAEMGKELGTSVADAESKLSSLGFVDFTYNTTTSAYESTPFSVIAGVPYTITNNSGDFIRFLDANNNAVGGNVGRGATTRTFTEEETAAIVAIGHIANGSVHITADVELLSRVLSLDSNVEELKDNQSSLGIVDFSFSAPVGGYQKTAFAAVPNVTYHVTNTSADRVYFMDSNNTQVGSAIAMNTSADIVFTETQAASVAYIGHLTNGTVTITANSQLAERVAALENDTDTSDYVEKDVGNNLYVAENAIQGAILLSSGSIIESESYIGMYVVTDKIYFGDSNYIITNANAAGSGARHAIYDANDNILGMVSANEKIVDKTNYPTASYCRLTLSVQFTYSYKIMVERGKNLSPWCPYNPIARDAQIEYKVITANSDTSSGADFVGNSAIKDAIDSITDATYYNRYIIMCKGQFVAELPSDYVLDVRVGQYSMFTMKDYVYLDGGNANDCIVKGSLPSSLAECQADTPSFVKADYGNYQPCFIDVFEANVKNITFISRNTRYPFHMDCSNHSASQDKTFVFEGLRLINEGKYGDSVNTTGTSASGFGMSSGASVVFRNCLFDAPAALYVHDNQNLSRRPTFTYENCEVCCSISSITAGMTIPYIGNPTGSNVILKNVSFKRDAFLYMEESVKSSNEFCNTNQTKVVYDGAALPINNGTTSCGLCITSATTTGSSVRFDETSSAFDLIVGDSSKTILLERNEHNRCEQYGYEWKDGGNGFNGMAVGLRNLNEASSMNFSLGKRLGDCSSSSKTLSVVIDGTTKNIVFNQNYTSMSNADIITAINTQLGSVGTASLYIVNRDWMPQYKGLVWEKVIDTTDVCEGMGVVFDRYTSNGTTYVGVRKAKSTDAGIDGICVDNGTFGTMVRVITDGRVFLGNTTCAHATYENSSSVGHRPFELAFGTKMGIGNTNGVFVENAQTTSLVCEPYIGKIITRW